MAYRRLNLFKRRRVPFKKRRLIRKYKMYKRPTMMKRNIHYFKRVVNAVNDTNFGVNNALSVSSNYLNFTFTGAGAVQQFGSGGYSFTLNGLPNYTEFTNLFDFYRISKVVVRIFSNATQVTTNSTTIPAPNLFLHSVIDHNDVSLPASTEAGVNELRQDSSYKCHRIIGNRPVVRVIKPTAISEIYNSVISTAYAQAKRNTWLDCGNPAIPHYGLKFIIEGEKPGASDYGVGFHVETRYYLQFKSPK